jgi:hypothetical protein
VCRRKELYMLVLFCVSHLNFVFNIKAVCLPAIGNVAASQEDTTFWLLQYVVTNMPSSLHKHVVGVEAKLQSTGSKFN